eukprot:8180524-Alexandrium_andersonii.AAC.1
MRWCRHATSPTGAKWSAAVLASAPPLSCQCQRLPPGAAEAHGGGCASDLCPASVGTERLLEAAAWPTSA